MSDERQQRFDEAVKRIENSPESRAVFDACRRADAGPSCLACATLRAENERLTDILIACCNATGGQAVKGVSVDFLSQIPAEITGRIERLTRERDAAVIRENDLANKYTAHPSHCPITGRPFFMAIESESGGMVATYGGPFDSYTIPEWSVEDKEFRSERYDHDAGYWVEGGEPYSLLLVDEDEYNNITAERDQLLAQLETEREYSAGLRRVIEIKNHDARAK